MTWLDLVPHPNPTCTMHDDELAGWWAALKTHASSALHGDAYDGLEVWPNVADEEGIPWQDAWRRTVEALELLALAEIVDSKIWSDVVRDIARNVYIKSHGRRPRPVNSQENAMTRLCRERMVVVTTSRRKNDEPHVKGRIGDVLHTLLRPRDEWSTASPIDEFPALRAKLLDLCGTSQRQRERCERLIIPVSFCLELHSSLPPLTPFERIRKAHCATLFEPPSLQRSECPFRLVDVSVDIIVDGRLTQEELRFQLSELRQSEGVMIKRLEFKGFHDDVTVAMRNEWLETIFASPRGVQCFTSCGFYDRSPGEAAAFASSLMHARYTQSLRLNRDWCSPSSWPWVLYALFGASATHSISELDLPAPLINGDIDEFDELTAARNPRPLLLTLSGLQDVDACCTDASRTPRRAIVEDGVVLDVWKDDLAISMVQDDDVGAASDTWMVTEERVFDVLMETERLVLVLVPHVGVCAVDRSLCRIVDSDEVDAWNLETHSIRRLKLTTDMRVESFEFEEGDDGALSNDNDEQVFQRTMRSAPCRFLEKIGRPLVSLELTLEAFDIVDAVLERLPTCCPNLKELKVDGCRLQSFESVVALFRNGLALESLSIVCCPMSATTHLLIQELGDPLSAMAKSLRRISFSSHEVWHGSSVAYQLLCGMPRILQENHQLRWVSIATASPRVDSRQDAVRAIEKLRERVFVRPLSMRHKLAFLSVLEAANRPEAAPAITGARVLAQFDSIIASIILSFSRHAENGWGEVLRPG
ncbi:hypothetical protein PINS_up000944 [Pythium insidiosum]|nr:hypothetical protein PINS_up000944 [Pythium insidiosum]